MVGAQDPSHGGSLRFFPWQKPKIRLMVGARDPSYSGSPGPFPMVGAQDSSHGESLGSFPWWESRIHPTVGARDPFPWWEHRVLPTVGSRDSSHSGIPGSLPWCQWPWHGRAGSGTARIWQEQPVSVPGLQPGKGAAPRAPISFKITKSQAGVPTWGGIFAPFCSFHLCQEGFSLLSAGTLPGPQEGEGCPWDDPGKDVMVLPKGWTPRMDSVGWIPRMDPVGWIPRMDTVGWAPGVSVGSARCTIPGWMDLTCSTGKDTKQCWISLYIPIFPGSKLLSCLAPPGQGCPRAPGVSRCPRRVPRAVSARCYLCYHGIVLE
ncbi:uncharacterized protein LOC116792669 isoform X2 [Chiroxiphia lanceolata]|uniref:uncharacterized protein LOC116792669 isoform X2 n=1 Tax=Chiroxiphia lanceolata TaxID=296741 RepID=UPI0013CF23C1|nr:uncharacterized protein LOC116792669 isoform X2 [Chiroxiphia lanceolata]